MPKAKKQKQEFESLAFRKPDAVWVKANRGRLSICEFLSLIIENHRWAVKESIATFGTSKSLEIPDRNDSGIQAEERKR